MSQKRSEWIFSKIKDSLHDKDTMVNTAVNSMLNRTTKMFKYGNLPDTITTRDIELYHQVNGFAIWKEVDGDLYVFYGGLGGVPNVYYLPTKVTIANPYLNFSGMFEIGKECEVSRNDYLYQGLMPVFAKYGSLLVEAEMSLKMAIINARVPALVTADDDGTAQSAREFFEQIEKGEKYGVVETNTLMQGLKTQEFYQEHYIKDLIESIQYIKGSWYNEIGLNSTFNMKREAINEAEASLNEDILYPIVENMMECRQQDIEKVNKMYGTHITVDYDSVWETNLKKRTIAIRTEKAEAEVLENQADVDEKSKDVEEKENEPV